MSTSLSALRARCDAALARALAPAHESRLAAAMQHAVLGGGKRLRPLLVYGAGHAVAVAPEALDSAAVAIELIHAYSLVHDDLPAMDDDDLRRGRPTVHRAFDEATAILAGDALQSLAFEILATGTDAGLAAETVLAQIRELAQASGQAGMAGGQSLDLGLVGDQPDLDTLTRMHRLKTGALITAAVRLGALAAGSAGTTALAALDRYALDLGLAFQIQDDVLDEIGDSTMTGKTIGVDRARGKPTYSAILGTAPARERAESLLADALDALDALDGDGTVLREIALQLMRRQH